MTTLVGKKSQQFKDAVKYFSGGQFIITDAGYALSEIVCTPYRQPYASRPENELFNHLFSSARTCIERVNGILKGRWASLRGIRTQLNSDKDYQHICEHILVCLILHNLMIDLREDEWEEGDEDEEEEDDNEHDEDANEGGNSLRIRVQKHLLQWYNDKFLNDN